MAVRVHFSLFKVLLVLCIIWLFSVLVLVGWFNLILVLCCVVWGFYAFQLVLVVCMLPRELKNIIKI